MELVKEIADQFAVELVLAGPITVGLMGATVEIPPNRRWMHESFLALQKPLGLERDPD